MIQHNDLINALFECGGAILTWINVRRLIHDKEVKGVYWPVWAFFSAWGLWNLYYYPSVGHIMSFLAGIILVSGNITWVFLARWYTSRKETGNDKVS